MLYDVAYRFWSLLSSDKEILPGGKALANLEVPLLLANAAWYPKAAWLSSVFRWYEQRNLPPAVIVPGLKDQQLEYSLHQGSFCLELALGFFQPDFKNMSDLVEQVSWLQNRTSARLLAEHYGETAWELELSQTLTRAMQSNADIQNYLAYNDKPKGAMITFTQTPFHLAMLLADAGGALKHRLVQDANRLNCQAYVLSTLSEKDTISPEYRLERWSIA